MGICGISSKRRDTLSVFTLLPYGVDFRYERKKNIALAISALQQFKARQQSAPSIAAAEAGKSKKGGQQTTGGQRKVLLVVAGGYDLRVAENVEYLEVSAALQSVLHSILLTLLTSLFVPSRHLLRHRVTANRS
jgi:hypothetical protein